jgi:predicted secreted protein
MGGHRSVLIGDEPLTVSVPEGGELVVEAEENPTTGHVWHLAAEPPDGIDLLEDSALPGGDAAGSAGRRRWRVRVRRGPRVVLRAALRRPWEAAENTTRTATVTFIVES